MNHLSTTQKQYLNETVQKLSAAMKKINFTREMSPDEADAILKELDDVKGELFMFGDLHPEVQQIELFKQAADLTEYAVNALSGNRAQYL
ncbi:hypothetical protein [Methylomonas koyamae]|uniref:Uncharacterized protein n=1 Tax=Methylomonas koyamae TaxID=702114 RepID=A0A291IH09_9GAMM|nr:hypothetical protein [Methylomonas koyamae]ATG89461.1 hypothetical protein MKLM6_1204 [Methylomonas koyamae]OAI22773.1 hypothetical protein A1356_18740 [Methylomonas koyamae]